jgi:sigma-E factor negative regulatory protein RseA
MSDQLKESVSALMDGEADELELRRLLANENSSPVDNQWSRYHLVRDVLQNNEEATFRHLDISKQVAMAVSEQPIGAASAVHSQWWRPIAGFAVAASVAVAVVVGVQSTQQIPSGLENGVPAVQAGLASSRVYPVQGSSLQAAEGSGGMITYRETELPGGLAASKAEADQAAQERLDKYILRHTERAALNNSQGVISFARVANFETE